MLVPAVEAFARRREQFDEAHAALDQPAGQQALAAELVGVARSPRPYIFFVASLSFGRSSRSGTAVCMRKASS